MSEPPVDQTALEDVVAVVKEEVARTEVATKETLASLKGVSMWSRAFESANKHNRKE